MIMISIRRITQTHEFAMLPFHGLLFLFFLQCFVHLTAASKHNEIIQNYNDSELLMKTVLKIDETTPSMNYKGLQMRPGVSFKMALFADLHYGEAASTDWGPQQDVNSTRVTSKILEYEAPDFVIYLGDVITANNIPIANATLYWDQAVSPTRRKGIPWASVFGNHDDAAFEWPIEWFSSAGIPQIHCPSSNSPSSGSTFNSGIVFSEDNISEMSMKGKEGCSFKGTSRLELMKNEHQHDKLSYSTKGPRYLWPSVSNYVLPVSLASNPNLTVAFLYFLDSGGGSYPQVISNAQVKWFRQQAQEINPDSRVPEIIFWHIPTQAYKKVAPKSEIRKPCIGSINIENVAAQEAENGIMEFLAKRPSVKAIFVGHNHGLDWCCPYEKLWLCFARHTGYGGYGNWPRGSRILEINQQPFSIKSWIRMEDGSTHSEVVLS